MGILILAANTASPTSRGSSSILASDGFMPSRFAFRGERLAFSAGIVALAVARRSSSLVAFGGRVEALIPLYAIGVFTSITLSQAGMVRHWLRDATPGWRRSIAINGVRGGRDRHRDDHLRRREVRPRGLADRHHHPGPRRRDAAHPPPVRASPARERGPRRDVIGPPRRRQRVIVPVADVTRDVVQALKFGRTMSDDVTAVHVTDDPGARRGPPRTLRAADPGRPARHRRVAVPAARPAARPLPRARGRQPRTTSSSSSCPSTCRATGGALPLQRERAPDPEALLGRPNILVADVPYRRAA